MNKFIITVFNTEKEAFEGLSALKDLHKNGDISLYATAVVNKNELGKVHLKQVSDKGPIGSAVGMVCGTLIGLLAGPGGAAIGAVAGIYGGLFYDLDDANVDTTFLDEISSALDNGKTAVVAEVDEAWTAPVDTKMDALNAMVFRRNKSEVAEEQFDRELDALNAEMEELEHDMADANDEMKASIQKQLDKAKAKRLALKTAIDKKTDSLKAETEAKVEKLNTQLKDASKARSKKIEKRKAKLKANFEATKEKLHAASAKASKFIS